MLNFGFCRDEIFFHSFVLAAGLILGFALPVSALQHRGEETLANPRPGGGPHSIASALDDLQSDDAHDQATAAQWLSTAALDGGSRTDVLKALETHVASDDRTLRLASVQAYAHWAMRPQVPDLMKMVAARSTKEAQDGSAGCSAAAVVGLVRLDPAAADRAVRDRMDDFFFRDRTTLELVRMAEMEPDYSASDIELLKLIDPDDKSIKMSLHDAETMLASDSASARTDAANALKIAPVIAEDRAAVLRSLSTHLQSSNGRTRLPYVRAFVHWADAKNAADLQKIVAIPETIQSNRGDEDCWASAIGGLVRLNMATAAIDAYNSRVDDPQLNFSMTRVLEDIARGTDSSQPLASNLLEQLTKPRAGRLMPIIPAVQAAPAAVRT